MNQPEKSLILFYHENSQACQKLKQFIPKDKKIQIVDVSQVSNLPQAITSIPALVIDNSEVLLGKKVFDYFNKTDEMEYLNFSGKNSGSTFGFSMLDDDNNVESGGMFSSIDAPDMSKGIPEWNDDDNNKGTLDLDRFQNEREEFNKSLSKQPPPQ
jgi:hypothetical protein